MKRTMLRTDLSRQYLIIILCLVIIVIYSFYEIEIKNHDEIVQLDSVYDITNSSYDQNHVKFEKLCSVDGIKNSSNDQKSCFMPTSSDVSRCDDIILFDDIFAAEIQPTPDRSVFFIATSCIRNGIAALNAR